MILVIGPRNIQIVHESLEFDGEIVAMPGENESIKSE